MRSRCLIFETVLTFRALYFSTVMFVMHANTSSAI